MTNEGWVGRQGRDPPRLGPLQPLCQGWHEELRFLEPAPEISEGKILFCAVALHAGKSKIIESTCSSLCASNNVVQFPHIWVSSFGAAPEWFSAIPTGPTMNLGQFVSNNGSPNRGKALRRLFLLGHGWAAPFCDALGVVCLVVVGSSVAHLKDLCQR
jgi:hypothetical protein